MQKEENHRPGKPVVFFLSDGVYESPGAKKGGEKSGPDARRKESLPITEKKFLTSRQRNAKIKNRRMSIMKRQAALSEKSRGDSLPWLSRSNRFSKTKLLQPLGNHRRRKQIYFLSNSVLIISTVSIIIILKTAVTHQTFLFCSIFDKRFKIVAQWGRKINMMKENSQDRRVRRTKTLLQTTLVELMLEKEISQISVKELTQKADVNRSTFYLHYLDIYDMLEQMENEFIGRVQRFFHDYFDPFPASPPITLFLQISQWLERDKEYYVKLLRGTAAAQLLEKLRVQIVDEFLHILHTIFQEENSLDLRTRVNFIVSGTIGVLRMWVTEENTGSLLELSKTIEDLLENGSIQDYPQKLLLHYPDYMQRMAELQKK